jgi:hypothetical protein
VSRRSLAAGLGERRQALGEIQSFYAEVHIYLFDNLPASPGQALAQTHTARAAFSGKPQGIEKGRGALELRADWFIDDRKSPQILVTPTPFRPMTKTGMQQVRVEVQQDMSKRFEYLFDAGKDAWAPVFDTEKRMEASELKSGHFDSIKRRRSEEGDWYPVRTLEPADVPQKVELAVALRESAPASGSFILMSQRRRGLK